MFQLNDALEKSVSELEKEKNSRKRVDSDYQDRINQMQELVQVITSHDDEYLKTIQWLHFFTKYWHQKYERPLSHNLLCLFYSHLNTNLTLRFNLSEVL